MSEIETRPCEACGVKVQDRRDPSFVERWLCYHCYCLESGQDPKQRLNQLATLVKLRHLVRADGRELDDPVDDPIIVS